MKRHPRYYRPMADRTPSEVDAHEASTPMSWDVAIALLMILIVICGIIALMYFKLLPMWTPMAILGLMFATVIKAES